MRSKDARYEAVSFIKSGFPLNIPLPACPHRHERVPPLIAKAQ